jgi:uncharacterized SAM-binding protein YcdF (DUF218 family)
MVRSGVEEVPRELALDESLRQPAWGPLEEDRRREASRPPARRLALTALVGISTALALVAVLADEPARWLVVRDPPRKVDAAIVLAGDPQYERTRTAARLVLAGDARLLIVTGGEPGPGDSAGSLRDAAIAFGVPPERIRMERVSHSTREALLAVRPILAREGARSVVLVTSPYHQRRTYWTARRALDGVRILNWPAEPSFWSPESWWRDAFSRRIVVSEYLKLAYYVLRGWA